MSTGSKCPMQMRRRRAYGLPVSLTRSLKKQTYQEETSKGINNSLAALSLRQPQERDGWLYELSRLLPVRQACREDTGKKALGPSAPL